MTFDLHNAPQLPRNVETENYATTSAFENLVTFEMQSADLRMWNAICCLLWQRSSSRPSSKAAGHLRHAEASEDHSGEVRPGGVSGAPARVELRGRRA